MSIGIPPIDQAADDDLQPPRAFSAKVEAPLYTAVDQSAPPTLQVPITTLMGRIEPPALQDLMRKVFIDLARLLEYLRLIETHLHYNGSLQEILAIFSHVHERALALLEFIGTGSLTDGIDENLFEALDGTSYAISLELRRVFECELAGLDNHRPAHQIYGRLTHAHGLLRNCFQQSTIFFAQVFDPTINGPSLFDDCRTRLEQSLVLCRDLSSLIQLMRRAEEERDPRLIISLIEELEVFRQGAMHYLIYRDREEYERLVDEVVATRSAEELAPVLHRFACYLEALLGQVKMRAVLKSCPPEPSGTHLKPSKGWLRTFMARVRARTAKLVAP